VSFIFVFGLFGCLKKPQPCAPDLYAPPETFQVAWISPVGKVAWINESIEVVPMKDLRLWVHENKATTSDLLQHLGMRSKNNNKQTDPVDYKITVFDVQRNTLCRPIKGKEAGSIHENVTICLEQENKPKSWGHRHGFSGCGYAVNSKTNKRSLDVFRVRWLDASAMGFCVFPMARFLDGA
jgi:hypothetical protein